MATDLIERLGHQCERVETATGAGTTMAWRRWGRGAPVVLLHGGAGNWMHWIRNIDALAASRTVLVPDMPGFGDSELPRDGLDADSIAPMVLAGIQALTGGERFCLAGFSFGGLVAAYIAASRPSTLARVVLVSVAGLGLMGDYAALKSLRDAKDSEQRAEALRFNLQLVMLSRPSSIDALALAIQGAAAPRDRVRNRKLAHRDVLPELAPQWRAPVHAIWGCEDAIYRRRTYLLEEKASRLGLQDRTFLEGAGHWLQYEDADRFNRLLAAILSIDQENAHRGEELV